MDEYTHPLASYGYGGPFRVSPTCPWDGEPWTLDSRLPEGFAYLPIVRWLGRWYAQPDLLSLSSRHVALVPLTGNEAVAPFRMPPSVVVSVGDEEPFALVYNHRVLVLGASWYTTQARVEYYAIEIIPRPILDDDGNPRWNRDGSRHH